MSFESIGKHCYRDDEPAPDFLQLKLRLGSSKPNFCKSSLPFRQTSMNTFNTANSELNTEFIHRRILNQVQGQELPTRNVSPTALANPAAAPASHVRPVARAVAAAIKTAVWAGSGPGYPVETRRSPRGDILLGILAYAYSVVILSTDDIYERLMGDPTSRAICERYAIDAYSLRRFRRVHRRMLRTAISQVLSSMALTPDDTKTLRGATPPGECGFSPEEEAEQRLQAAAQIDFLDLEDRTACR
jgi:hypothetical protein